MPTIRANGVELAFVERGAGEETVVFSHSYLVDHRHFEPQIEALAERYRVIAYDHRDHGASERVAGPYTMADLVADAAALIRAVEAAPCHFVGLSTGGFVGLRLALRQPELLRSLVAMDCSAESEALAKRVKYQAMFAVLRTLGFGPLIGTTMKLMFGPGLLDDPQRKTEADLWRERIRAHDPAALIRFGNAIFGRGTVLPELGAVDIPTLVVVGEHDRPQPPARSRKIAEAIPGALLEVIPRAGHLSTVDAPAEVTGALARFLARVPARA